MKDVGVAVRRKLWGRRGGMARGRGGSGCKGEEKGGNEDDGQVGLLVGSDEMGGWKERAERRGRWEVTTEKGK